MNNYSTARVAVVGAAGYAGRELLRLLARHPRVELVAAMGSERQVAVPVAELAPGFTGRGDLQCVPASLPALLDVQPDFVLLATPHETSMTWAPALLQAGEARVIDLSGAFRLGSAAVFEQWYGQAHTAPELLSRAVYGWPERYAGDIVRAELVANPGCYAIAASLALWPLVAAGAIESRGIVCDAKSGASGAGRGLRDDLHFVELETNCKAYGVFRHRHTPEIAGQIGVDVDDFTFTPHLLPTSRGILATCYVRPRGGAERLREAWRQAYSGSRFVRLQGERLPEMQTVAHTNFCDLGYAVHPSGTRAVVVSCIDNLGKGAAGQALQNLNCMAGWPEETGLL